MHRRLVRTVPIAVACACVALSHPSPAQTASPESLELSDFTLELDATWEQLTDTVYKFEHKQPLVANLAPAVDRASYAATLFRKLLPPDQVRVGDTWQIRVTDALPLLRQLHPGATEVLHHDGGFGLGAHGGWGCLRAINTRYADVRLRLHADFLIAGDGSRGKSSWFTPAQFAGTMVIDRESKTIVAFDLGVPDQSANVDVNIAYDGGVTVDIGRIPRMEVRGGQVPANAFANTDHEISVADAELALVRRFYPFAAIEWLDLEAALAKSQATGKPLHVVALFGSLLDESC